MKLRGERKRGLKRWRRPVRAGGKRLETGNKRESIKRHASQLVSEKDRERERYIYDNITCSIFLF